MLFLTLFFFKPKTAYEVRISDWSSDVCSSDLDRIVALYDERFYRVWITGEERPRPFYLPNHAGSWAAEDEWPSPRLDRRRLHKIGKASRRERECQYGCISLVAASLHKKKKKDGHKNTGTAQTS